LVRPFVLLGKFYEYRDDGRDSAEAAIELKRWVPVLGASQYAENPIARAHGRRERRVRPAASKKCGDLAFRQKSKLVLEL
jgi:hypothetical protein